MKEFLNQKVIVTTSQWFYAPDGKQYKAVWGTLKGVHSAKDVLGFTVNASHANFYIEVGSIVVAGCQALYCVRCDARPDFELVEHQMYDHQYGAKLIERKNEIYLSE